MVEYFTLPNLILFSKIKISNIHLRITKLNFNHYNLLEILYTQFLSLWWNFQVEKYQGDRNLDGFKKFISEMKAAHSDVIDKEEGKIDSNHEQVSLFYFLNSITMTLFYFIDLLFQWQTCICCLAYVKAVWFHLYLWYFLGNFYVSCVQEMDAWIIFSINMSYTQEIDAQVVFSVLCVQKMDIEIVFQCVQKMNGWITLVSYVSHIQEIDAWLVSNVSCVMRTKNGYRYFFIVFKKWMHELFPMSYA